MPSHSLTGRGAHSTAREAADAADIPANAVPAPPATERHSTNAAPASLGDASAPTLEERRTSGGAPRARTSARRRVAQSSRRAERESAAPQAHRRPGRPTSQEQAGLLDTREHILRQARGLFMQRGFADVSVGEVAELVGVTKPTLYYHFESKQGLYTAVLCDMMREVGGYIEEVVTLEASVRARLRLLALGYLEHARMRMEPMLRDTFELIGQERAAEVIHAYHTYLIAPIANLLRAGVASGEIAPLDPDILTRAFLGLLDTFNDRDHERSATSATGARPTPADAPQRAHAPAAAFTAASMPADHLALGSFSAALLLPTSATTRLADTLVSIFMDGVAARPYA